MGAAVSFYLHPLLPRLRKNSLGNFFAVATATCLRIAISSAYIQYVWRRIKHKAVSLETVDNAFEALSSVLAFAHLPLLRTMYTGVAALVVFWSVLLP